MKIERFDEIYSKYYKLSLKVAYSVVHDVDLAQDICQEVFIHMFFKLDEIDEKFAKAWILAYSKRIAVDFCRKSYNRHEGQRVSRRMTGEMELGLLTQKI